MGSWGILTMRAYTSEAVWFLLKHSCHFAQEGEKKENPFPKGFGDRFSNMKDGF